LFQFEGILVVMFKFWLANILYPLILSL